MPHVYILQNKSGKYYVGSTTDLSARLVHHQGGHTPSTKRLGQVKLVFAQEYSSIEEARRVELKLKRLKRKDYLANIVQEGKINIRP